MRLFECVVCCLGLAIAAEAQTGKTFPSDDEIRLVVTQAERAIQIYAPLIDQEERQIGKILGDGVGHDREVVSALQTAIAGFRRKPQAFNGPLGFSLFELLDDASRNALACSGGASSQVIMQLVDGNTGAASSLLHLAQTCADASALIYTVSENAGALYQRVLGALEQLASQAAAVAEKCTDILKKGQP